MVFQAGFVSLMRTLLIIAAFFFVARLFVRYLAPLLLGRFIKRQQDKFYGQYGGQQTSEQSKEGEVRVKSSGKQSQKTDDLGEYVEYEEVDESK